jgi:glycosyltransferase involved in cell wall biosynthesis
MVARVAPQKDFDTLIRAAALVVAAHPEARFLIVGDKAMTDVARDHYSYVVQLLSAAGLTKHFIFTGYRSDTFRLLAGLDAAVLSTHQEGLPLALIETMAYAKATVATAVDGVPELIRDGWNGFLCRHEDAESLAEKLLLLLDDPQRAAAVGQAARETVLNTFTGRNFAESIAAVYRRMLK